MGPLEPSHAGVFITANPVQVGRRRPQAEHRRRLLAAVVRVENRLLCKEFLDLFGDQAGDSAGTEVGRLDRRRGVAEVRGTPRRSSASDRSASLQMLCLSTEPSIRQRSINRSTPCVVAASSSAITSGRLDNRLASFAAASALSSSQVSPRVSPLPRGGSPP